MPSTKHYLKLQKDNISIEERDHSQTEPQVDRQWVEFDLRIEAIVHSHSGDDYEAPNMEVDLCPETAVLRVQTWTETGTPNTPYSVEGQAAIEQYGEDLIVDFAMNDKVQGNGHSLNGRDFGHI